MFLHYNLNHDRTYRHLQRFKDLVYVCSVKQTYEWAQKRPNGHAIFLPLSIDVEYVEQFRTKKTKQACYAGNKWTFKLPDLKKYIPEGVDFPPENLPREELLKFIAPYKECYAVGRTAIEARCLGAEIKICDSRYLEPSVWQVIDNKEAAEMLQEELDIIDELASIFPTC